jgi:Protein of unknown function (DUF3592)
MIAFMGLKSVLQDYRSIHKLTHLDEEYRAIPAKFLLVQTRRDTTTSKEEYYPDIRFEYFVAGKSVWGWRFSWEEEPRSRSYWEKRLERYHAGDTVTAYVNPDDAKDSFVEKKWDNLFRQFLKAAVGLGFMGVGGILCVIPVMGWFEKLLGRDRVKK